MPLVAEILREPASERWQDRAVESPSSPGDVPELATERLGLVAPALVHLEHYLEFFTDAEASASYGGPLTEGQAWARLAADRGTWALRGFGVWVVTSLDTGSVFGGCGFWQGLGWPHELTWWLRPDARGSGVAREASQAAIRHAYEVWGWPTVQTYMTDDNEPARALALRLGGLPVGRHVLPDGEERTIYVLPRPDGSHPAAAELGDDRLT